MCHISCYRQPAFMLAWSCERGTEQWRTRLPPSSLQTCGRPQTHSHGTPVSEWPVSGTGPAQNSTRNGDQSTNTYTIQWTSDMRKSLHAYRVSHFRDFLIKVFHVFRQIDFHCPLVRTRWCLDHTLRLLLPSRGFG